MLHDALFILLRLTFIAGLILGVLEHAAGWRCAVVSIRSHSLSYGDLVCLLGAVLVIAEAWSFMLQHGLLSNFR